MRKHKAMTTLVNKIGDTTEFVDHRDTEDLELTAQEQNQLTKLSLSKIVSNLRNKLKEEQTRVQSVSLLFLFYRASAAKFEIGPSNQNKRIIKAKDLANPTCQVDRNFCW